MIATMHDPVLLHETVDLLGPPAGGTVVDGTFGGGGHARAIAERLGPDGLLVAIDRDPDARERFDAFAAEVACATRFVAADFAAGLQQLAEEGLRADGVLLDLGLSSFQVDTRARGFSYSADAPLDMRMDPTAGESAADAVATWDERRLARVLRDYAEERHAGRIARAIVRERERRPIETTQQLVDVVAAAVPTPARFAGGHPAKRTFQALRIAVNDELGQLDAALPAAWALLRPGGVLAVISFHSLEDRRTKRFLADRAQGCTCPPELPVCVCGHEPEAELLVRRGVVPSDEETARNPRSTSARLRAARKLEVPA
jgi:16S rRNA (cytosine1402-N4)-methyltransferase